LNEHLILPKVALVQGVINPAYNQYLKEWREDAIRRADEGDTTASICHQATLIDLVLYGKPRHAWNEVMMEYLTDDGRPLAYSEVFGKHLHRFDNQYRQTTIHAIHTRWWIECLTNSNKVDHELYATLVLSKRQADGLIYDADVSETILRHRMKTELTLSMAMSAEILQTAGKLTGSLPLDLSTSITDSKICPTLGYMSMEYFRLKALEILGYQNLFPVGIAEHVEACAENLDVGWCDFSMKSKVDAYMGTAKRTERDKPIHSPLIACYVAILTEQVLDADKKARALDRLALYASHLKKNPLDIPAFQMRDVPIRFGVDKTPIEIICASHLIAQC
jgi:hypothetical protein